MSASGMTKEIKEDFGRRLRAARDAKKYSRQVLGTRLGVSPKTIQSWEMGRTFIENLSLIPAIERELEISISKLIEESTSPGASSRAAESETPYGRNAGKDAKVGPLALNFNLYAEDITPAGASDLDDSFVAVPVIKPTALKKEISSLQKKDIIFHTVIPSSWVPRGGILIGCRMGDSYMDPMIPHGCLTIIDRRELSPIRAHDKPVVIMFNSKGIRIRKFKIDGAGNMSGVPANDTKRGVISFHENKGDKIIGKVVGVLASW